jgi:hypothetical protein
MPSDMTNLFNAGSSLIEIVIMLVGIYRAIELRKGFVDSSYRSRILWSISLMALIVFSNARNLAPLPNNLLGVLLGLVPFLGIVLVSFGFIDKIVIVAIRSDFFHRNTLNWMKIRIPSLIVLFVSTVSFFVTSILYPEDLTFGPANLPLLVFVEFFQFIAISAVVLALAGIAGVVASRRTSDQILKRNVRLLAFALLAFVLSILIGTVLTSDIAQIASDLFSILATYLLYLSVMSMTPLGKIEKRINAVPIE